MLSVLELMLSRSALILSRLRHFGELPSEHAGTELQKADTVLFQDFTSPYALLPYGPTCKETRAAAHPYRVIQKLNFLALRALRQLVLGRFPERTAADNDYLSGFRF